MGRRPRSAGVHAYPVTCSACGHRWESTCESGRTRCGRCLARIYVPAAQRRPVVAQEAPDEGPQPVSAPAPPPAPSVPTGAPGRALAEAIGHLPTAAHRATFRLLLDAVVARHHLRGRHPAGWPSFVLGGPSKSAKTLLAVGACKAIGADPALAIRLAPRETEASLWGRRAQGPGGRWSLAPSDVLSYPFLAVDELDKVAAPVVRSVYRLLQGDALVAGEGGQLVEVRPTTMVIGNAAPAELVHEAYLRRSVVLDTGPLAAELGEVHTAARAFLGALPVLDLAVLRPPADELPEDVTADLLGALRAGLSEAGWRSCDERALSLLALGRATLAGTIDLRAAALAVAGDYLDSAATVGEVAAPPGRELALPDAAIRRQAAEDQAAAEVARRQHVRAVARELAARQAAVVDELEQARPDPALVPAGQRQHAVMIGGALDAMANQLGATKTLEELAELLAEAGALVEQGRALCAWERRAEPVVVEVGDEDDEDQDEGGWDDDGWEDEPAAELPAPRTPDLAAVLGGAGWAASRALPGPAGVAAAPVAAVVAYLVGERVERRTRAAMAALSPVQPGPVRRGPRAALPAVPTALGPGQPGSDHLELAAAPPRRGTEPRPWWADYAS